MSHDAQRTCEGITKGGQRCRNASMAGRRHCLMHDADAAELRRQAARKGGANSSNQARAMRHIPDEPLTAQEMAARLSGLLIRLTGPGDGIPEPKVATAAATLAKVINELSATAELDAIRQELAELRAVAARRGIA